MISTNMCFKVKFVVIYLSSLILIITSQKAGEPCRISNRNLIGTCKTINNCPRVLEDHKLGIRPEICFYGVSGPYVCCPGSNINNNQKRISVEKCEQYAKLTVQEEFITTLDVNPSVQSITTVICEYIQNTELIVGGTKAKLGEFPHMAAIYVDTTYYCGGSLISERFVLTAAHCTAIREIIGTPRFIVRLGDQNLRDQYDGASPEEYRVIQVIKHPDYRASLNYNDIALLKLESNVRFSKFIRPACLWQTNYVNGTSAIATGWGSEEFRGQNSDELLKVTLNLTSNTFCGDLYPAKDKIPRGIIDSQICAGSNTEAMDTCQGDSGGPLQVNTESNRCTYHIIGVTSFGEACGLKIGVYTRVSSYINWIESIVWT